MATVTTPSRRYTHEESRQRVYHPLQRLRGTIRLFVTLEGLGILLLYLALWFWIGLLLDYGVFKAFAVDWVQILPWVGYRVAILTTLVSGLLAVVAVKVFVRLFREFRPAALALVLERRFPKVLGDRLITAVELADPQLGRKYGYSQAMIDHTIQDAADRVDQVPVGEVFNWRRLWLYGGTVIGLTLGLYLLAGAGWCAVQWRFGPREFAHQFKDVAAIWYERNILLHNTIWPRRAHLEMVGYPEKVSRTAATAPLRVRALKWVRSDGTAAEGWRSLYWWELDSLLGHEPPELPAEWLQARNWHEGTVSVDQVDLHYSRSEVRAALQPEVNLAFQKLFFEDLEGLVQAPENSRKLRKLIVPQTVTVFYKGENIRNEMTLTPGGEQEYSGIITDLKESIRFTVNGEDYYTPSQPITVVPPPDVVRLARYEEQPAYLYQRPPLVGKDGERGSLQDLRGLKQIFNREPAQVSGEGTWRVDVPAGTNLILTAEADKDLAAVALLPHGKQGQLPPGARVEHTRPEQTFKIHLPAATGFNDFEVEFTDTDDIKGKRHLIVKADEDAAPEVDVVLDVIRRTPQGFFLVTPYARVPMMGTVRDSHGLDQLQYAYTIGDLEAQQASQVRAALVAGAIQYGSPSGPLVAPWYLDRINQSIQMAEKENVPESRPVDGFRAKTRELSVGVADLPSLRRKLQEPPPAKAWLKDFTFEPDVEFFDLERYLPQAMNADGSVQRRQLRLWVTATDNNIDTGPSTGISKEKFTLLVVSVEELLAEIGREEEGLHVKLEDTWNKLRNSQLALEVLARELRGTVEEKDFGPFVVRAEQVEDVIIKSSDIAREVFTDYRRILKEMQVNRVAKVNADRVNRVDELICKRLDGALLREFPNAEEAQRELRKLLDSKKIDPKASELALQSMQQLIDRLREVLDAMDRVTNINDQIKALRALVDGQRQLTDSFRKIKERIELILIEGVTGGADPKKG